MVTLTDKQVEKYARARVAIIRLGERLTKIDCCTLTVDACIANDRTLDVFDYDLKANGLYDAVLKYQDDHDLLHYGN